MYMERKVIFDEKGLRAFAQKLKSIRKEKRITQEELACKTGLALSQIARIETVQINTSLSTVFALSRGLEVPLSELFNFDLP